MGACSQQLWLMFCFQRTSFKKWYKFKFWSWGSKQRNLTLIKLYSFWVPWACSALASSRWKPMFLTPYSATLYCNEYSILEGSCFWLVFLDVAKTLSFDFFCLAVKKQVNISLCLKYGSAILFLEFIWSAKCYLPPNTILQVSWVDISIFIISFYEMYCWLAHLVFWKWLNGACWAINK